MAEDYATVLPTRDRSATTGPDAVGLLSLFLGLLIGIPSRLIVGPLGAAGTLAQIVGMALAAWWIVERVRPGRRRAMARSPIRVAMWVFMAALLASYIAATVRPIDSQELREADLGLLVGLAWLGVEFTAMDAIPTHDRLHTLLRRLVFAAGALAALGVVQYVAKRPFTNYWQIPGLRPNSALVSIYDRGGLFRAAGTAIHPIEFGAVLTLTLPLALHFAMTDLSRSALRRWFPVAAMAFAIPIAISRSAIVSTVVVLLLLMPTWPARIRRRGYLALVLICGAVYVLIPGLLSTLTKLFTGISDDSSARSRTDSYALAGHFIERSPVFGRGFLTFLPSYRILDNQYLGLVIDTGIFGLLALLSLFAAGVLTCRRILAEDVSPNVRSLSHALIASIVSAGVSFAFFDAFSFPMAASLVFFVLGCAAALHRLVAEDLRAQRLKYGQNAICGRPKSVVDRPNRPTGMSAAERNSIMSGRRDDQDR